MTARKPKSLDQRAYAIAWRFSGAAPNDVIETHRKAILRELRAAVRAEREACAEICDEWIAPSAGAANILGARIRARPKP